MISHNVYKYVAKKEVGSENSGKSTLNKVKQVSLLEDFSEPLMCQYLVGLQKWAPVSSQSSLAAS